MCSFYPCWPTPDEAIALIAAGYGHSLMIDVWEDLGRCPVRLLCPKTVKGKANIFSACSFFKLQRCQLHTTGLKPLEGRLANHALPHRQRQEIHDEIAEMWDTPDVQAVVELWLEYTELPHGDE
ncbi:MAG: hypothetical protein IT564_11350 [Rhodospirillales bacterium]|nr:hypothetical protein [Rhodospirillales bacterium]